MKKEAKTGLFIILFFILLFGIFSGIKVYNHFFARYYLYLAVKDGKGINVGDVITIRGVNVGNVLNIGTGNDNLVAKACIDKDIKIPVDSKFKFTNIGMFEKGIKIIPTKNNDYYQKNDTIFINNIDTIPSFSINKALEVVTDVGNLILQTKIKKKLDTITNLLKEIKEERVKKENE